MARGNQGHGPDAPALKKNPAKHEGRRRRAGGATGRQNRIAKCQSLLTFLTRPSLTRRIASQKGEAACRIRSGPPVAAGGYPGVRANGTIVPITSFSMLND